MVKWEYKSVRIDPSFGCLKAIFGEEDEKQMNQLGAEGWEAFYVIDDGRLVWFKRQVQE